MASAQPVFWDSRDDILAQLRLGHVAPGDPTDLAVDEALRLVRAGFIKKLGVAQVNVLQAITYVEDPQNQQQGQRFIANTTEMLWVRKELLVIAAVRMLDAGGSRHQEWNYDGFLREMSAEERQEHLYRLQAEIDFNLEQLEPDAEELGEATRASVTVFENTSKVAPFQSIFPTKPKNSVN